MKAYTDLEQSKKLVEILPVESADMCFVNDGTSIKIDANPYNVRKYMWKDVQLIPCWSLAALLNIIPQEIFNGEYIINITEALKYKWIISYESFSNISSYIHVSNNSLIDCCVEMIIKLKERNLL
jgi:hypothetical protein